MTTICLHDRDAVEEFFRRDAPRTVYSLGDLDDAFRPHTTWHALVDGERTLAIALLYSGLAVPTLLCMGQEQELTHHRRLLQSLLPLLPSRFYCHLGCGLADVLEQRYALDHRGLHRKMGLTDSKKLPQQDDPRVAVLSKADLAEVQAFYAESYPGNCFEPRKLETERYYGLRLGGRLVSIAGVHVYSPAYRVAALGDIATHPAHRGRGYAREVTGQLCRRLLASADHIGLNVKADNAAAIACYQSLGFDILGPYDEFMADMK